MKLQTNKSNIWPWLLHLKLHTRMTGNVMALPRGSFPLRGPRNMV